MPRLPNLPVMVDQGKYYFLSRPRRFGKSLTVSWYGTVEAADQAQAKFRRLEQRRFEL